MTMTDESKTVKTVVLPPTRAAQTWDRATDALVAAAEKAEAEAKADYEASKDRYQKARQDAHMIRQLRQIARVDGQSMVATIRSANPKGKHSGRCAAPNPCNGCQRLQEAQTHGD